MNDKLISSAIYGQFAGAALIFTIGSLNPFALFAGVALGIAVTAVASVILK